MTIKKNIPHIDEERDEFSPILPSSAKENPFVIPDGYFDELPSIIQDRCINLKNKKTFSFQWKYIITKPQYIISLFLVLIAVAFLAIYPKSKKLEKVVIAQNNAIESKLNEMIDNNELEESLLVETLTADTDTVKTKANKLLTPENKKQEINLNLENPEITPDDILRYFQENEEEIDPDETL
jgi:hypothetical protein